MDKQNLTRAHEELFRRSPDECFSSLPELVTHCQQERERSTDRWQLPQDVVTSPDQGPLTLHVGNEGAFNMNEWSFTQLCKLARVVRQAEVDVASEICMIINPMRYHHTAGPTGKVMVERSKGGRRTNPTSTEKMPQIFFRFGIHGKPRIALSFITFN